MKVIGITGASGSGKTTISEILDQRPDTKIINADKMAKELTNSETEYLAEIKNVFEGKNVFFENGDLNRKALANLIYNNNAELEKLNSLTFKHLIPKIVNEINNVTSEIKIVIIDAPLLFESGLDKYCDSIITFSVPDSLKIDRICNRDNISKDTAKSRLKIQNNNDFYMAKSDYVIINDENTTIEELEHKINEIINRKLEGK